MKNDEKSKILDDEKNIVLDHDYDAIQELDHPLPSWWVMTFYGGIFFAIIYSVYFFFMGGFSIEKDFQEKMTKIKELRSEFASEGDFNLAFYQELLTDQVIAQGEEIYNINCIACHLENGKGGDIGPNLADNFWKNGDGSAESIYEIVYNGRLEAGMPPWADILQPEELYAVTAYVRSLRGVESEGAKGPEGQEYPVPADNE